MKKIIISAFLICVLVMASACGSQGTETSTSAQPQINPLSDAANRNTMMVNLYYGYKTEQLLAGEERQINVPVNERIETTVVTNLIQGASTSKSDFSSVINPDTKIVNVTDNNGFLFVTLSKEFLLAPAGRQNENMNENIRRYLAAYSIVDTLIEEGGYTRVQILIDRNDTGAGTAITNMETGLTGNDPTEPLARDGGIILNSRNTMREIMSSIQMKDWSRLYGFISYKDTQGIAKPTLDQFKNAVTSKNIVLSGSQVTDHISSTDLDTDYVMTSFTIKAGDNEPQS
ncbi:MAG: GerMN domain-containing protein, partial [Eubacteriales bacterium]